MKKIITVLIIVFLAGNCFAKAGKLISYKNKWLSSYETLGFDTPDGDLDFGQYALDENGKGYYIRTKPKNEAQFEHVDLKYDITGLTEVHISGKAYYDEFLTAKGAKVLWGETKDKTILSGGIIRLPSTGKKYWDTARIKNYPQPERTEMVEELPPEEPKSPPPEHHSIALDAASNSVSQTDVSSYSWSHTCTGDNRLLVVGDSHRQTTNITVSSITFNADGMTSIRSDPVDVYGEFARTTLFYLVAPDTGGAYTVTVTLSGVASKAAGGAISYTGAAQTGQPDANNGATGSSITPSVNVTTVADNSWVASVLFREGSGSTTTCNNTERWKVPATYTYASGSDTNGPKTPAGVQTMSWTLGISAIWAISAASFAPYAAPPAEGRVIIIASISQYGPVVLGLLLAFWYVHKKIHGEF